MDNLKEEKFYKTGSLARIDTDVLSFTNTKLSEVQQRTLLFLISKIDLNDKTNPLSFFVPFKEFVKGHNSFGLKWKKNYKLLENEVKELLNTKTLFTRQIMIHGKLNDLTGGFNWFSSIEPKLDTKGDLGFLVEFTNAAKPYLIDLKKYTRLHSKDISKLSGAYTINLFSLLSAIFSKEAKYSNKVKYNISLDELNKRLGCSYDRASAIAYYLRIAVDNININSSLFVTTKFIKKAKKIENIEFVIEQNKQTEEINYVPTIEEKKSLKQYEYLAYLNLVAYGIKEGIAFKQMVPKIPKGIITGFEDKYINKCIEHFEANTIIKSKKGKIAGFVAWFLKKDMYTNPDSETFIKLKENVLIEAKELSEKDIYNRYHNNSITILEKEGEQVVLSL